MKGRDENAILEILAERPGLSAAELLDIGLERGIWSTGVDSRGRSESRKMKQSARDSVSTICNRLRHAGLVEPDGGRPQRWSLVAMEPEVDAIAPESEVDAIAAEFEVGAVAEPRPPFFRV